MHEMTISKQCVTDLDISIISDFLIRYGKSLEEENNPETKVPPEQIEALKLQAQTVLKEKKELEQRLAQAMSQLEETRNTRSNIERHSSTKQTNNLCILIIFCSINQLFLSKHKN